MQDSQYERALDSRRLQSRQRAALMCSYALALIRASMLAEEFQSPGNLEGGSYSCASGLVLKEASVPAKQHPMVA
jgi:hypothetical protein